MALHMTPFFIKCYNDLMNNPFTVFFQRTDGLHFYNLKKISKDFYIYDLDIYPGSFNPLHQGHEAIFDSINAHIDEEMATTGRLKCYEVSIERKGKESLSIESLHKILLQFHGKAPVIITRVSKFLDKTGIVRQCNIDPTFHIGYDTFTRMVDDHGVAGCGGIGSKFVVYDRKINDRTFFLDEYPNTIPDNFTRGKLIDKRFMGISSSDIRKKNQKIH